MDDAAQREWEDFDALPAPIRRAVDEAPYYCRPRDVMERWRMHQRFGSTPERFVAEVFVPELEGARRKMQATIMEWGFACL